MLRLHSNFMRVLAAVDAIIGYKFLPLRSFAATPSKLPFLKYDNVPCHISKCTPITVPLSNFSVYSFIFPSF